MKFIRVDMTRKSINVEEVPEKYFDLGGRGLTSVLVNDEVPPKCNPLGPENKLIVAPGLLSGINVINTSRISVGTKSPLTGTIKEANGGGTIGNSIGRLGIKAIIIEGQASKGDLYALKIEEKGNAELIPVQELKGLGTYATVEKMHERYGKEYSVMCIGQAGEYLLGSASIQCSDTEGRPCRAAARGGVGAVMGSKGLKAILVHQRGKADSEIADREVFQRGGKAWAKAILEHPFTGQLMPTLGTASLVAPLNAVGAFPSYNATSGTFDKWENITGEKMAEMLKGRGGQVGHAGCAQCATRCSNIFVDKAGKYVTSSLEYETIFSLGGMIGNGDLDMIAKLDNLCDDIGLDTINTGVSLAIAMDAGYRPWGAESAIEMLGEIRKGSEIGMILGNGPVGIGKYFNHHRVPAIKGQSIAAFDPRGVQGYGVMYAKSTQGADHTIGPVLGQNLASFGGELNPYRPEGQVDAVRASMIGVAAVDSLGICLLASFAMTLPEGAQGIFDAIAAKLGKPFGADDLTKLGVRVLRAEREFNLKAGFTNKDDRLPKFFYDEPLPPHNTKFLVTDEDMDTLYNFLGE